ncbi:HAMP domain-containing histidine kinase [Paenibacillus hemerocallicola]|uniref:histidine kinase n=1 Tax=Paenibacillus hemerocallicola TaxID=1172614 RepID=A0A5C4T570_9BACL|nr:HAMP domain-containing sensor histidine kinase [Paenibacillus hemerocallicola]TNJ64221.1 HAMP domain-containing histidine kinase [Paenibacillus hemerocallicola]
MVLLYCTIFVSLWTLGTIMLVHNPRNAHVRWFSVFLFVTGFASFSVVLNVLLLPWMRSSASFAPENIEAVRLFTMIAWGIEYHFLPYLHLMCALVFSRIFRRGALFLFSLAAALPIVIYLVAVPPLYPELQLGHPLFRILSGVYFAAGISIYWIRYSTEKHPSYRKNSFRTSMALMVCISFLYGTDYLGMNYFYIARDGLQINGNNLWQYNFLISLVFVALFVFYSMKYGFMGIKLRIERQKLDYSMKNLTKGALILNHTIKNEIQKINYLSSRMRTAAANDDKEVMLHDLESLDRVTGHILGMMNRIKEKTDEIVLHEQEHRLSALLDYSVQTLEPILAHNRIHLSRDIQSDPVVLCDAGHIREVLGNMLGNAIDAMEPGKGKLTLSLLNDKKEVLVWVRDNGSGIPKESAAKIFDPFFTTKKGSSNYGLGLNYCYGVMQKHGGSIRLIETNPGAGTWMELRFPAKRVRTATAAAERLGQMRSGVY